MLADQLRRLKSLSTPQLWAEWERVHKAPAPAAFTRELLLRALAYELQVREHSGLPPATDTQLRRLVAHLQSGRPAAPSAALSRGALLVREWQGTSYRVAVVEDGYEYRGRSFRSLSAIAREITGVAWSGPRFFGLHAQR